MEVITTFLTITPPAPRMCHITTNNLLIQLPCHWHLSPSGNKKRRLPTSRRCTKWKLQHKSVKLQPHISLPHTDAGAGSLRQFMVRSTIVFYGAKHHSIATLESIIFNTLNMFLYISKKNFSYLINVRQKFTYKKWAF